MAYICDSAYFEGDVPENHENATFLLEISKDGYYGEFVGFRCRSGKFNNREIIFSHDRYYANIYDLFANFARKWRSKDIKNIKTDIDLFYELYNDLVYIHDSAKMVIMNPIDWDSNVDDILELFNKKSSFYHNTRLRIGTHVRGYEIHILVKDIEEDYPFKEILYGRFDLEHTLGRRNIYYIFSKFIDKWCNIRFNDLFKSYSAIVDLYNDMKLLHNAVISIDSDFAEFKKFNSVKRASA